jgi:flagellar biosynthetic protein FlhB
MADPSKTEQATPKKKQEAREKGQIAKSVELNSAVILLTALITFRYVGPYLINSIGKLTIYTYENMSASFGVDNVYSFTVFYMMEIFKMVAPILLVMLAVGLIVNYAQVGVLFTLQPLTPKLSKINPISGFQRLFSRRSLIEFFKSVLKLTLIAWIGYAGVKAALPQLIPAMDMQGTEAIKFVGQLTLNVLNRIILALIVIAALDFLYQRWEHNESLKMSKQEIKDEFRQAEGDPMIKARIRQIQREMARRRMFEAVPKATVVITNPTHVAVALEYKDGMQSPMVLAKGERVIAEKIKEMARKHNVPIVENPPLARALLKQCPIGAPISPDLFEAVAEVLAFVYRMNRKKTVSISTRTK